MTMSNNQRRNAILVADIHFGEHNNSTKHNDNLLEFFDFLIEKCKVYNPERVIILGDYFHDRNKVDVQTLNYGIEAAKKLYNDPNVPTVDLIEGNHDLYQRYSRDISSLEVLKPYFRVYEKAQYDDSINGVFVPWLSNPDDYSEMNEVIQKHQPRFVFGHFEFNGFQMNKNFIMDQGDDIEKIEWYNDVEKIFTGHYHGRQDRDRVLYVGTPFPFNGNDANDFERGLCVLDLDSGEYSFEDYDKIKVLNVDYETYQEIKDDLDENTQISVSFDDGTDFETMDQVQKELEQNGVTDYKINYTPKKDHQDEEVDVQYVESIDEVVLNYIEEADIGNNYDKNLLKQVYQEVIDS